MFFLNINSVAVLYNYPFVFCLKLNFKVKVKKDEALREPNSNPETSGATFET